MTEQEKTTTKKRGRPATGLNPLIGTRMPPEVIEGLDAAIAAAEDEPGRPEMIRRIVTDWLKRRGFMARK